MLNFGEGVKEDYYNQKLGFLDTSKCDKPFYIDLISSCFHQNITTSYITSFVRSICLIEFGQVSQTNKKNLDKNKFIQDIQTTQDINNTLLNFFQYKIEDSSIMEILTQLSNQQSTSNYSIALLSSIHPSILKSTLDKLNINNIKSTQNLIVNLDDLEQKIQSSKYIYEFLDVINTIDRMEDKSHPKALQILIKCLKDINEDISKRSAVVLSKFPPTELLISTLIDESKKHKIVSTRLEIITTLGEFGNFMSDKIIPILKDFMKNENIQIVRRSIVSLSKILGEKQNIEERKELSLKLCRELKDTDNSEEKKQVIIGLRYLKIIGEQEISETLLKLLSDGNSEVQFEAAKTLTILNPNSE